MQYKVGDIGHPKSDKTGKVLVLATAGMVGFEIDAADCHPTSRSDKAAGLEYRTRYFRNFPGKLRGNP